MSKQMNGSIDPGRSGALSASKCVPLLRFPEFEGEWEKKKLELIGEYIGGGTPDTSIQEYWEGNIPWISSSDIIENDIHNINIQKYITDEAIKNSATKKIPANSLIIVSRVGVGKFAINKMVVCTSQDFTNIVVNTKIFDPNFSAYNLYKNIDILYNISQGTSIKGFTTVDLKKSEISFPSLPEQTKIANFLTAVDEKLHALKKKKAHLELYKKGVMQKLFPSTGLGQSPEVRFKITNDKGELVEPQDWEVKKFGEVLTIGSGKDYKHLQIGNIPVYGTGGLMTHVNSFLYDGPTVCIGRKGTIDSPKFHEGKIWTVDTLFFTHSFKKCIPKYIFYVFQTINWKEYNEASGVPSLSKSTIEKINISIPSIQEQTKIANFLSTLDEKISHTQSQIEKTEVWKKGLLQKMFV